MAVRHLQENNLNLLLFTSLNFQSWLSFFRRPDLSNRVVRSTRPFLVIILILMAVLGTYTNRFSLFSKHFTRRWNAWLSSLPLLTQQIFLVYWFDINLNTSLNLPTYLQIFLFGCVLVPHCSSADTWPNWVHHHDPNQYYHHHPLPSINDNHLMMIIDQGTLRAADWPGWLVST